jgi:hypothetical protein
VILKAQLSIEAHPQAATAYLCGPLSPSIAARVILAARRLPPHVRRIRVDLRAVTICDLDALTMLEVLLIEWSSERRGMSRVVYPRRGSRDAFVAIPCTIRDAPDSELQPERDDRVVSSHPIPVW